MNMGRSAYCDRNCTFSSTLLFSLTADALLGVKIFENSSVQEVIVGEDNRIKCVDTGAGLIETANFVDAAGIVRKPRFFV